MQHLNASTVWNKLQPELWWSGYPIWYSEEPKVEKTGRKVVLELSFDLQGLLAQWPYVYTFLCLLCVSPIVEVYKC